MSCPLSRRQFLNAAAGLSLGAGLGLKASPAGAGQLKPAAGEYSRGGMLYRRLGRTDIDVSVLGFGSHTNPEFKIMRPNDPNTPGSLTSVLTDEGQAQRDRQIARAFDLGVNILDIYESQGQREPAARVVRPRRDKVLMYACRQLPSSYVSIGDSIDEAARLYGHVDLFRLVLDGRDPLFREQTSEAGISRPLQLRSQGQSDSKPTLPTFRSEILEDWDVLRKAKEVGKVRAIGFAAHFEIVMDAGLDQLEGLDFVQFPYNFIQARADYGDFMQRAIRDGIGLIAMKPLAGGSIARLDPRARPSSPGSAMRAPGLFQYQSRGSAVMPAAIAELTKSLDRLPDETLCQAALRFVYSRPFITCALNGMFQDRDLDENYAALTRQLSLSRDEVSVLEKASHFAKGYGPDWVPPQYRWLEEQWGA
jgi:aryl-alcohol dehydrogenase-like predicted oxidoreductase